MDQLKFVSASIENPRNLGLSNKRMVNDYLIQKPMTPIIDRFKAVLRDREDKIRALGLYGGDDDDGDTVSPPRSDEIVRLYELVLSELTFNSKPIITDLTIIAGEQREHAEGIANAICERIIQVRVDQKLPCLYLLDSIAKNIGKEYVRYFSVHLPEVFCETYSRVNSSLRASMRQLFGTWSTVFPPSTLCKIDAQLKFSPAANHQSGLASLQAAESARPTHGIHVNPKYLEARGQFEHTTDRIDIQHSGGTPSLKMNGNHGVEFGGYESDNSDGVRSQVGTKRFSTEHAANTSSASNVGKLLPSSAARNVQSSALSGSSHVRLSPPHNEFDSTSRFLKISSPSNHVFDYGPRVVNIGNNESSEWEGGQKSHDNHQQYEYPDAHNDSNNAELRGPRALIEAYGTDERDNRKPRKAGYLNINAVNKGSVQTWKDNEEEEFKWEDMSPTLATGNLNFDNITSRPGVEPHGPVLVENNFRRDTGSGREQISAFNGSSLINNAAPSVSSGHGLVNKIPGLRQATSQFPGSRNPPGAWNFPQPSEFFLQVPFIASAGEQKPSPIDGFPDKRRGSLDSASRMNSSNHELLDLEVPSALSASTEARPPLKMQTSNPLPPLANFPLQKHIWSHSDSMSAGGRENPISAQQQLNSTEFKAPSSHPQFSNQQAFPISPYQQNQAQGAVFQPPYQMRPEIHPHMVPSAVISNQSPFGRGYMPPAHRPLKSIDFLNPIPSMQPSLPFLNIPNSATHLQGVALPPLHPGSRSVPPQMKPAPQNPSSVGLNPQGGGALSGLFNSLMAQGLISLTNQPLVQDPVGLEFNADLLKVRHESAITALYADLPRQCTTCGLRFKCQEEHSSHMDWHVTKNRISKNRKQKPSRKWFVSADVWLSGTDALGVDAVPGFLPTENIVEERNEEESAVPADEDQNVCALCGEPFDDFYSDETEEWMYKAATYMNAPTGSIAGMNRSQLGPIVHTKCRSDSNVVAAEDLSKNEMGYTEDGSRIKRLRA